MKEELKFARFRTVRFKSGLTQQDVIYLLGLDTNGRISKLEKRMRMPTLNDLLAYRIIFGCTMDELLPQGKKTTKREMLIRQRASKLRVMLAARKTTPMLAKRLTKLANIGQRNRKH